MMNEGSENVEGRGNERSDQRKSFHSGYEKKGKARSQRRSVAYQRSRRSTAYESLTPTEQVTWLVHELNRCGPGDYEELFLLVCHDRGMLGFFGGTSRTQIVVNAWAKADPEGALQFLKDTSNVHLYDTAVKSWAQYAERDAVEWIIRNSKGEACERLLGNVIAVVAKSDIERCIEISSAVKSSSVRGDVLRHIAAGAMNQGKALELLERVAQPGVRQVLIGTIISEAGRVNPSYGKEVLSGLPEIERLYYRPKFAVSWAEKDARSALEWAQSLGGQLSNAIWKEALPYLARQEGVESMEYANSLTGGDSSALKVYYQTLGASFPEIMAERFKTIPSEIREDVQEATLRSWYQRDEVAAKKWIELRGGDPSHYSFIGTPYHVNRLWSLENVFRSPWADFDNNKPLFK